MNSNTPYLGYFYAFDGSGGFNVQQSFDPIILKSSSLMSQYDMTNVVQVKFSVRTINRKLGIIKDASNIHVVEAPYNPQNNRLAKDSVNICTCDFIDGINLSSVISVGFLQNLYTDFKNTVNSYFGDPNGFAILFANSETFDINNGGIFDANAFVQVINSSQFQMTGSYVSDLSGQVSVNYINDTLHYTVSNNFFQNRNYTTEKHYYSNEDGYIAGDLIFIPKGFTITLSLDIQEETIITNTGPANLAAIDSSLNYTRGYIQRSTTYTTTNIRQTTIVPILLILTDTMVQNYSNYGNSWTVSTNIVSSSNTVDNWIAISISNTGKYQTAITDNGDIYVSEDYGASRTRVFDIGSYQSNSISISFTGQYQTASNGHNIFVSSDYGSTWNQTFSNGTSNIFLSISLTGQYQTVLSTGDTVYLSRDYGNTWTSVNQTSDLFYSIEAFPQAGVALSYNGLYQTIVSEYIYISNNYGTTWTNVSITNGLTENNWIHVDISSDGKYQTALEIGGNVWISKNYGVTWTMIQDSLFIGQNWVSVSMSATGQYQTIVEDNGEIYCSNDYASSWYIVSDPLMRNKDFRSVSVSSDALYQCICEYGGEIYMSHLINNEPYACD